MLELLQEAIDPSNIRLTETQLMVLCSVYAAATPELGYENTLGAENTVLASHFLAKRGLIHLTANGAKITQLGHTVMEAYDLIDVSGELTERGKTFQEVLLKLKTSFKESLIPYSLLKTLI